MLRRLRSIHRFVGLAGSIALLVLATSGFLLALKREIGLRPETRKFAAPPDLDSMVSPSQAISASIALGLPELKRAEDVDRLEYQAAGHVYKVLSATGYLEVQIDAASGKVLRTGRRNDQLTEDVHDLSILHPALRTYVLPVVALCLFTLGSTGIVIYFIPVVRRAKFRKRHPTGAG